MPRVGLALGGGGARGIAHFGVLKVLEQAKIPIDMIAGTSMGAIVGAMYAQNPDAADAAERFRDFLRNVDYDALGLQYIVPEEEEPALLQRFARTIARRIYYSTMGSRSSILKPRVLRKALAKLLDKGSVKDARIPFCAVAADLNTGKALRLRDGNMRKAVLRSALIPGYLPPESDGPRLITDGGVVEPVPVDSALAMGADVVIAVSVDPSGMAPMEEASMISIMRRCDLIRGMYIAREQTSKADVAIHPDLEQYHWSEFLEFDKFLEAGVKETEKRIGDIRRAIRKKHWFWRFLS